MPKAHARHSPSTIEKLRLCTCFKMKDMLESSDEGTALHHAAETGDLTGLDEEQKSVVNEYLTYINNVKVGLGNKPIYHAKERKLELKDLTFGFCDDMIICGQEAHVFDFKSGRVPVSEAEFNDQVQIYCAALMEEFGEVQRCTGHLVGPRMPHASHYMFERGHVQQCRDKLEALYDILDDPFKRKPTAHADLCYRCARANECPLTGKLAVVAAAGIGLPVPSTFAPDAIVSAEDRAKAQLVAQALENWAEQVKAANLAFCKDNGGTIPGYDLKSRSTGKRVPRENSLSAVNALIACGYVPQETLLGTVSLSIPELAKAAMEIRGTKETEERARLSAILGDLAVEGRATYLQRQKKSATDEQLLLS